MSAFQASVNGTVRTEVTDKMVGTDSCSAIVSVPGLAIETEIIDELW